MRELPGMFIFLMVILGTQQLAFHFQEPVMGWLSLHGGSPGEEPPWYFITLDFADGICASGALLLSLIIAVVTWRWYPTYSSMMVWMPLISYGGDIAQAWLIHQACPGIIDGQRITSRWPTFDSYLYDEYISRAQTLFGLSGILLAVGLPLADRYIRRKLTRPSGTPPAQDKHGEQDASGNRR
jgi:hypothetical protein